MFPLKIKVGHYYSLMLKNEQTILCVVLYGFERGKNKDVYTLRIFDGKKDFEFPVEESTFDRWVEEGRVKEVTAEEALAYAF
jgi:hypothetical protein